jgi:DNA recombination protein RmuC
MRAASGAPDRVWSVHADTIVAMDVTTLLLCLGALLAGVAAGLAAARGSTARAAAERDALRSECDGLRAERVELDGRARAAEAGVARLGAALEAERAAAVERAAHAEQTEARLREAFQALSAEALRHNTDAFLSLAESRLRQATTEAKGDLVQRQQAIEGLVAPLRDTLGKVESQIRTVEKDREGAYQALLQQIGTMRQTSEQLRVETAALVTALRAPQVRGRWGELQLRRVVEAAGMVEHCDFDEQETSSTDDGVLRPDLVVRLAGGKNVVVDAKVAFGAFLEANEARDESSRAERLRAHARHLRGHIDALAGKSYWERFDPSPEFVVCFVPADVFLDAALQQEPTLLEHAFERNVVIATPSTLVALLRTVAYTWRQEALASNARQVHTLARVLYTRLATLGGHISGVGDSLNKAVKKYNEAVGSLESRVLVTARQLNDPRWSTSRWKAHARWSRWPAPCRRRCWSRATRWCQCPAARRAGRGRVTCSPSGRPPAADCLTVRQATAGGSRASTV